MKKLFLDLEKCRECKECVVSCDYFYHPKNNGIPALREAATFAMICRQCDEAACVVACPKEALEKQRDGALKRYNMRCVGCRTCSLACPFGTIVPEIVPYLTSQCDYCLENEKEPACIKSCPEGAVKHLEVKEETKDKLPISDFFIVHAVPWKKEK